MPEETTINGERCELITDFEQLREADVVYVVRCMFCGAARHRALLGRRYPAVPSRDHLGTVMVSPAFSMLPNPHARHSEAVLVPANVDQRMIWRVIDPQKATGEDMKRGQLDARPRQKTDLETLGQDLKQHRKHDRERS